MRPTRPARLCLAAVGLAAACGGGEQSGTELGGSTPPAGPTFIVADTAIASVIEAAGIAAPVQRAVLATRLMGSVVTVLVSEGGRVRAGQLLARIDARDIEARGAQVRARIAEAEAVRADAATQAERFRALFAEEAATKAQLEAAETGLARAEAALHAARASESELEASASYAEIRAPFTGIVVERSVDRGTFVAPGQPVAAVEDASRLRVSVTVAPGVAQSLRPGDTLLATIEAVPARAVVEGVVPSGSALYTVNAMVDNPSGRFLPGSAATLAVPEGRRRAILVPEQALVREGDLTGVRVRTSSGFDLRWVRTASRADGRIEVLSGLQAGEEVLLPAGEEVR
jgi:RND family efflux transporter MFP subunit